MFHLLHPYYTISRGTSAALLADAASSRVTPKLRRTSAALPGGPLLRNGPCEAESEGIPLPYSTPRHLSQYVTWRANANGMMKLRRFTKRLRYRCGRCFANFNRSHPTRRGVLSMETRLPAASLSSCDAHLPRDNYGDILHHFSTVESPTLSHRCPLLPTKLGIVTCGENRVVEPYVLTFVT